MDFQGAQYEAKQNTTQLVVLLALGLIAIVVMVTLVMTGVIFDSSNSQLWQKTGAASGTLLSTGTTWTGSCARASRAWLRCSVRSPTT